MMDLAAEGGVVAMQGFAKEFAIQMGIDLCGRNAFMTKHLLYSAQVGAAFDQVGGEGMPESMWRDALSDPGLPDEVFQEQEDHDAGKLAAPAIEEDDVFAAWFWRDMDPDLLQIDADIF